MKISHLLAAAAIAVAGSAASASTVSLTGGAPVVPLAIGSPPGQDFVSQLQATGATHLYSGPLSLTLNGNARVTFSLVAAESAFTNSLLLSGSTIITENFRRTAVANFATDILGGETFTTILSGGTDIASLLTYHVVRSVANPLLPDISFNSGDDEFGVFADTARLGSLTSFYLALDDDGGNRDDNHDDIIIRVDIAPVPLPAAGLMLLVGLGGLYGMRRRRKAA